MGKLTVNGKEHSASLTGGVLLRFKRETGYDFIKSPEKSDSETLMWLAWCAIRAEASRNGEKYEECFENLCDSLSLMEVNALAAWLKQELNPPSIERDEDEGEKKSVG